VVLQEGPDVVGAYLGLGGFGEELDDAEKEDEKHEGIEQEVEVAFYH